MATNAFGLYRVHAEVRSISEVARTVTASFGHDPLISWLRPAATPWSRDQHDTHNWQYRRIQRAILDGIVFRSASNVHLKHTIYPRGEPSKTTVVTTQCSSDDDTDAGVVALLFPSKKKESWTPRKLVLALKLWILDIIKPVIDAGTNLERLEQMMNSHNSMMEKIKTRHHLDNLWYLEVLAVHPSLQSRGLGGKAMNWILHYIHHEPIVLECTSEKNIRFYKSLGFRVVEEVNLADKDGAVKCWMMLREEVDKD